MKRFVKYIVLLLAGVLAASCIFDADRCVMSPDEQHDILFTVSLESLDTKATWGEDYPSEEGMPPFDFRIIPENLRVVVYANDGTRLGTIRNLDYWPINETHTQFQFIGQLPDIFAEHFNTNADPSYRFMVLANCGDNLSGDEYVTYSQTQLDPASENGAIPMWGVKEVDLTPLLNMESQDIGEISLLRAAAKIEVMLSDNLKNEGRTVINSATLKYYNQTGYSLPSGWSQATDTKTLDQENCFRVYRHAAVNLPFIKDEKTGNYFVYVTEYDNINYSEERNKISLEFTIDEEVKLFEEAISFCDYTDGKPQEGSDYNIVRNHIYEFEILNIAGDNIILEYEVADWVTEDWGNGLEYEEHELTYPTYHNPVVPVRYLTSTPEQIKEFTITEKPVMSYSGDSNNPESGAFECYFQITAPSGVEWKPAIAGGTLENYRVRAYSKATSTSKGELVYDSGDASKQQNLNECKSNEWYRIVVYPLSDDGAGSSVVDFIILYNQKWTEQYIHLYINGEYDHIRWPDSGDNPKIIKIQHVAQQVAN